MEKNKPAVLLVIFAAFSWGATFNAGKAALSDLPPSFRKGGSREASAPGWQASGKSER